MSLRVRPTPSASPARDSFGSAGHGHQSDSHRNLRSAITLTKSNDIRQLRRWYDTWRGFLAERQHAVHLKRCAVALKHSNVRQQYTKIFVRWLAHTQQSAAAEARATYAVPKDVPLRSKRDVLAMVSRYFGKWRRQLRERRQRTRTNVQLLSTTNEDRLRTRYLLTWITARHRARDEAQQDDLEKLADHAADLASQLESRAAEVAALQAAVADATGALNGNPAAAAQRVAPVSESPEESRARTEALAAALKGAIEDTISSFKPGGAAGPLAARVVDLEESLAEAEAAGKQARGHHDALRQLVEAVAEMMDAHGSEADLTAEQQRSLSVRSAGADGGSPSRPSRAGASPVPGAPLSQRHGTQSPPPVFSLQGRLASPKAAKSIPGTPGRSPDRPTPYELARSRAEQLAADLAAAGHSAAPQRLMVESARLVQADREGRGGLQSQAAEILYLREAVLRAIDAFGRRRAPQDAALATPQQETPEASARRSKSMADSLTELCEDMVVVLVMTSLWSQDGEASERVSESLERLSRSLNHAETDLAGATELAELLMQVVNGAADLLGVGMSNSANSTDECLRMARLAAPVLANANGEPAPQRLLVRCAELEGVDGTLQSSVTGLEQADRELQALKEDLKGVKKVVGEGRAEADNLLAVLAGIDAVLNSPDGPATDSLVTRAADSASHLQSGQLASCLRQAQALADTLHNAVANAPEAVVNQCVSQPGRSTFSLEGKARVLTAWKEDVKATMEAHAADLEQANQELEDMKKAAGEGRAEADDLLAVLAGIDAVLNNPEDPATSGLVSQAADSASHLQSGQPASCLRQAQALADTLRDAVADAPEAIIAQCVSQPDGPTASLEDKVRVLTAWKEDVLRDVLKTIQASHSSDAVAAFLRDVLRDVIHRVGHLNEEMHDDGTSSSTRMSLVLDRDADMPRPLSRNDPSGYLEYILSRESIGEGAKLAVQDHMAKGGAVVSGADPVDAPCTWDVFADLHEHLTRLADAQARQADALLGLREVNEQLTRDTAALRASMHTAVEVLEVWPEVPVTASPVPPLSAGSSTGANTQTLPRDAPLIATFDGDMEAFMSALFQLKAIVDEDVMATIAAATARASLSGEPPRTGGDGSPLSGTATFPVNDLPSLVAAITDMRNRHLALQKTAEDGIAALGGADSPEDEALAGRRRKQPVDERLAAAVRDTSASIQEAKEILGIPDMQGQKRVALRDVLPSIRAKIYELDVVKKDSEAFIHGLDHAFNDDSFSSVGSVASSARFGRTLKAKKKPLPALEGSPTDSMNLSHKEARTVSTNTAPIGTTPEARLKALRARAMGKIDEVQDLRMACRAAINILEGSYQAGQKPPAYGEVLVPLLLSELEDIKKGLPLCEELLSTGRGTYATRKNSIATKLNALTAMVQSLQIERDGLRGELAGKGRQGKMLLEDMNGQADQANQAVQQATDRAKQLDDENAASRARLADLGTQLERNEAALRAQEEELAALRATAENLDRRLAEETAANDALTTEVDHVKREAQQASERAQHLEDENVATKSVLADVDAQLQQTEGTLLAQEAELAALRASAEDLRQRLGEETATNDTLTAEVERAKLEAQRVSARIKQLDNESATSHDKLTDLGTQLERSEAALNAQVEELAALRANANNLDRRLAEEMSENDALTTQAAQRQHDSNILAGALARALVQLAPEAAALTGADDTSNNTEAGSVIGKLPPTVADVEPFLLSQLSVDEGRPLGQAVEDHVAALRQRWYDAVSGSREELGSLRADNNGLREELATVWEREYKPRCAAMLAQAEEDAELLRIENDRLRPRALEREALLQERSGLRQRLERAAAAFATAEAEADGLAQENNRLRSAVREAEVEQVIRAIPASAASGKNAPPVPNAAELERRMIRGATTLTMEAIDSIAGENMAHTFGDVAAQTVDLFREVEGCVQALQDAVLAYDRSRDVNSFAACVGNGALELDRLADAADLLWTSVPDLFKAPFTSGR